MIKRAYILEFLQKNCQKTYYGYGDTQDKKNLDALDELKRDLVKIWGWENLSNIWDWVWYGIDDENEFFLRVGNHFFKVVAKITKNKTKNKFKVVNFL